ncbi:Os05g0204400 [Oryza sativa Japonica Group]|uniref:Os05g0204400 protein n=1 Tax=Oryza sativa subsp. japonica TaxID=39947 RepID=A0A0P0WJ10_ORYSJ|nr:Os05g0204400 [Oryza sativa Japonica Group]
MAVAARQQRQQLNDGGGGGSLGGHQLRLGHEHDHPTRFLLSPSAFHLTIPDEVCAFNRQLGFFFTRSRLTPTWHGIFELARRDEAECHLTALRMAS